MITRRNFATLLLPAMCARGEGFAFDKLTAAIKAGSYPNTHALLVEHEGRLIYEQYFSGRDERWGQPLGERTFDANSLHDLRSASKSGTAALPGVPLGAEFETSLARS